jgi:hypothetical protein
MSTVKTMGSYGDIDAVEAYNNNKKIEVVTETARLRRSRFWALVTCLHGFVASTVSFKTLTLR